MGERRRLPDERKSFVHRFEIGGHKGFIIVGMYENGMPGELFISMSKEGSTLSGLLDTIGVMVSLSLQHGVPLESLVGKLADQRFEPAGMTNQPCIKEASSITDYVARYIGLKFLPLETLAEVGVRTKCHDCDKVWREDGKTYSCLATVVPEEARNKWAPS